MIIKINEKEKQLTIYEKPNCINTVFFLYDKMLENKLTFEFYIKEQLIVILNKLDNKIIYE